MAKINLKTGWSIENEITWTEWYIGMQQKRLQVLYEERAWWDRFLDYCRTGKII